jgi:hypothetical protein
MKILQRPQMIAISARAPLPLDRDGKTPTIGSSRGNLSTGRRNPSRSACDEIGIDQA